MRKTLSAAGFVAAASLAAALLALGACGTALQDPAKDSSKALTAFSFAGEAPGSIDEDQRAIHVALGSRSVMTGLVALFETTGASVTVGGVVQRSGSSANDFSYPLKYRVAAEDGTTADYLVAVDPPLDDDYCLGVLVDSYKGDIGWGAARNGMVDFAFIRARQGESPDGKFAANWAGARAAGVLRGAYMSADFSKDAVSSSDLFLADFSGDYRSFDLPPLILCEAEGGTTEAERLSWLRLCVDRIEAEIGIKPIIATGGLFWSDSMGGSDALSGHPLMICHYTTADVPTWPAAWAGWEFWNYSASGTVPGIAGGATAMLRLGWRERRSSLFAKGLP